MNVFPAYFTKAPVSTLTFTYLSLFIIIRMWWTYSAMSFNNIRPLNTLTLATIPIIERKIPAFLTFLSYQLPIAHTLTFLQHLILSTDPHTFPPHSLESLLAHTPPPIKQNLLVGSTGQLLPPHQQQLYALPIHIGIPITSLLLGHTSVIDEHQPLLTQAFLHKWIVPSVGILAHDADL